jgi:exopolysaccharide biosynthesis polyprenyl glycosylphosphotransferase
MKRTKLVFDILRVPIDFVAVFLSFLLAYHLRPITDLIPGVQYQFYPEQLPPFDEYLLFALAASAFLILLFSFNRLYHLKVAENFGKTFLKIIFLVSIWVMLIIAYYSLVVHALFFSRIALAHIWLFSILFLSIGRLLILLLQEVFFRFSIGRSNVLFFGVNSFADECYRVLNKDQKYNVIGALANQRESRKSDLLKIIGTFDQYQAVLSKYRADEIILAETELDDQFAKELLAYCRSNHIRFYMIPESLKLQSVNIEMEMVDDVPLINLKQTPLEGWGTVHKRIMDITVSFILIILLLPFWIVVPILIKIDSKGPVVYKSKRKYRDRVFCIYKFRSMYQDADKRKKELLEMNERKGPLFKIKNDPRVTRVGRLLRKTSIDELPQLFNVLFGSMSLVGPRPHMPEEVDQYESHHYAVFAIKPGVTGLAQVNGRSNLDFEEEIKLDFFYIENWSLWLDLKIILKSIWVVLKADGH